MVIGAAFRGRLALAVASGEGYLRFCLVCQLGDKFNTHESDFFFVVVRK